MPSHLGKVKKKMNIYAKRKVRNILSGNYGSVFKGRGMDFDDLRVYEYGDDVKDIDWKASARSRNLMLRRYVAIRKHNILIVADARKNMSALAPSGETKAKIASFVASVFSYIANKNDDLVGMVFGNNLGNKRFPLKENISHIENFLTNYDKAVSPESGDGNLDALLTYVSKNFRERMFLIIITDAFGAANLDDAILRRLRVRHELLIISIKDMEITNPKLKKSEAIDIVENLRLPRFIRKNRKLKLAEEKMYSELSEKTSKSLKRLGIRNCFVEDSETAIPEILKMLEEQKRARK